MPAPRPTGRYAVAFLSALLVFQAGAVAPAFVSAQRIGEAEQDVAGSTVPGGFPQTGMQADLDRSTPTSAAPSTDHDAERDPLVGEQDLGVELIPELDEGIEVESMRTEYSRTLEQADGTFVTDIFSSPIHFQPPGLAEWRPVDMRFRTDPTDASRLHSDNAPTRIAIARPNTPGGFMSVEALGRRIAFALFDPPGAPAGITAPVIREDGLSAEYTDFLPGGIGLRVFPRTDGVKSFLVLPRVPDNASFTFAVSAPGLSLTEEPGGSVALRDVSGTAVARIPAPYLLDSSGGPDDGYSEAVSLDVGGTAEQPTVTISVDPGYLASAIYPVFVDPSVTVFGRQTDDAIDTFISSSYPSNNYNGFTEADGTASLRIGYNSNTSANLRTLVRFPGIAETIGEAHIDDAKLRLRAYWQSSGSTSSLSYIARLTSSWAANTVTWSTAPTFTADIAPASTSSAQGQDVVFGVTANVQAVVDGAVTHHGYLVRGVTGDSTTFKKLYAAETGFTDRPRLRVEWHRPIATPSDPTAGETTTTRTFNWTYSDNDTAATRAQSHFRVQVSTSSSFSTLISGGDSGIVAGSGTSWTLPSAASLTSGTTYHWRVKVKDGVGWSDWGSASFVAQTSPVVAEISSPASNEHRRGSVPIIGTAAGSDFEYYNLKWATGCTLSDPGYQTDSQATSILADPPSYTQVTDGTLGYWNTGTNNGKYRITLTVERLSLSLPKFVMHCITVDNTPPTASLATPPISGLAPIVGVATDNLGFKEYVLEWAPGEAATSGWSLVDPASPVFVNPVTAPDPTAPLAMWDTTGKQGWHTLRLTVHDQAGSSAVVTQNVYVDNEDRHFGTEPWFTSVPFDLGGGWSMAVGVEDGELALDRHLFEIPSYGPPQAMALRFGSLDQGTGHRLGVGWTSNLTQYLSFATDLVTWHTATGERVPFTPVGGSWSPLVGHYESMTHENGSYTVTLLDQSKLVFADTAPGRLQRVEDRFGNALTFNWGTSNATATDASGRSTSMVIDANGRITSVTDSAGRAWTFEYANGELTEITDPAGHATNIEYSSGSPTAIVRSRTVSGSPEIVRWEVAYSGDMVASVADPLGLAASPVVRHTFSYGIDSTSVSLVRAYDTATTTTTIYALDARGRVTSETDPRGFVTERTFDAAGNVNSLVEPVTAATSVTTRYTFDPRGNLVEVDAPFSGTARRITRTVMTLLNDPDSVTVADGTGRAVTTDFAYAGGQLTSSTVDPTGLALMTTYTYTATDQILTATAADGVVTKYEYDAHGNLTAIVQNYVAGGAVTSGTNVRIEYVYDPGTTAGRAGLVTSEVDPLGRVTTYEYDALGRLMQTISNDVAMPSGTDEDITTRNLYDEFGWETASVAPVGYVTRSITDALGRTTTRIVNCTDSGSTTSPAPAECVGGGLHDGATNIVTDMAYDARGNIVRVMERAATGDVVTAYAYDAAGNRTTTIVDEGPGNLNLTIEHAYDAQGREVASRDPRGTVTRSFYDDAGNLIKRVDNCTNTGTTIPTSDWATCTGLGTRDATWNVTTSWTFDERGNETTIVTPDGRMTSSRYDTANRLIESIDNDVVGTPAANEDVSTFYAYDAVGQRTAIRAAGSSRTVFTVTRYLYDRLGRLLTEIRNCTESGKLPPGDPGWKTCSGAGDKDATTNLITQYEYDALGNRIAIVAAAPSALDGTALDAVTTRYAYDSSNRLCGVLENATVALASPDACTTDVSSVSTVSQNVWTRYAYDAGGKLVSTIDARGNTTAYGYDGAGRMIAFTDGLGNTTTRQYNAHGQLVELNARGIGSQPILISWTYDGAGRMLTRTADGVTASYGYDASSNRTTAQSGSGSTIASTYDRLNRPLTVSVGSDTGSDTTYSYSFTAPSWTDASGPYTATLDAFGRQIALSDPVNGLNAWSFDYRADGQLGSFSAPNGNQTVLSYDPAGALTTKATRDSFGDLRIGYAWTRNRAGLVLLEDYSLSTNPAVSTRYAYDALGRINAYTYDQVTTDYGWQAVLNRESVTVGSDPTLTTNYDAANRPTSDSINGSYSHNFEGHLTQRPGQQLDWDSLGRLTAVWDDARAHRLAAYTYDALDRLLIVDRGASDRIRFRYVGLTSQVAQIVSDQGDANPSDDPIVRSIANDLTGTRLLDWTGSASDVRYYGTNGHHDTTWTADGTGSVTATLRYDPWGQLVSTSGSALPDHRFQGSWLDVATDLYWMVSRWYAPTLGRFISEDSLLGQPDDPFSMHLYAYAAGDPVGRWDPDGRVSVKFGGGMTSTCRSWHFVSSNVDCRLSHGWGHVSARSNFGFPTPYGARIWAQKWSKSGFLPMTWSGKLRLTVEGTFGYSFHSDLWLLAHTRHEAKWWAYLVTSHGFIKRWELGRVTKGCAVSRAANLCLPPGVPDGDELFENKFQFDFTWRPAFHERFWVAAEIFTYAESGGAAWGHSMTYAKNLKASVTVR